MNIDHPDYADTEAFHALLLAYLLQEISSAERERINRRMLVDEEFSAALKDAEYDLVDAYAAGELEDEQRRRVYLALISHAPDQAALSRAMQQSLDGSPNGDLAAQFASGIFETDQEPEQARQTRQTESVKSFPQRQNPAKAIPAPKKKPAALRVMKRGSKQSRRQQPHWMLAGLAAALVAVTAWTLFEVRESRRPEATDASAAIAPESRAYSLQANRPQPEQSNEAGQPSQPGQPEQAEQAEQPGLAPAPAPAPDRTTPVPSPGPTASEARKASVAPKNLPEAAVMTLILPEATRAAGYTAPTVKLSPKTLFLRVQWQRSAPLPPSENDLLVLQLADDSRVLTTVARSSGTATRASFLLPVKDLSSGQYLFRVMSRPRPGEPTPVYSENLIELTR